MVTPTILLFCLMLFPMLWILCRFHFVYFQTREISSLIIEMNRVKIVLKLFESINIKDRMSFNSVVYTSNSTLVLHIFTLPPCFLMMYEGLHILGLRKHTRLWGIVFEFCRDIVLRSGIVHKSFYGDSGSFPILYKSYISFIYKSYSTSNIAKVSYINFKILDSLISLFEVNRLFT